MGLDFGVKLTVKYCDGLVNIFTQITSLERSYVGMVSINKKRVLDKSCCIS